MSPSEASIDLGEDVGGGNRADGPSLKGLDPVYNLVIPRLVNTRVLRLKAGDQQFRKAGPISR